MSNHSGSYMLNDVLKILEQESVFQFLGKEKTQKLIFDVLKVSNQYDCNPGEILEDIGEKIGICYCCQNTAEEFYNGICQTCHEKSF